jgi:hypothetical protein
MQTPVPGSPSIDAILCGIHRPVNPHFRVVLFAQVRHPHAPIVTSREHVRHSKVTIASDRVPHDLA